MSKRGGWLRRGVDEKAAAGLALRHDDALALLREGQPELAVPQLEQILIGCRTVFGLRQGPTLTVEGNLAVAYLCAERLDEGHALLLDAYRTRQRVLGEYDAATLTAADCLATAIDDRRGPCPGRPPAAPVTCRWPRGPPDRAPRSTRTPIAAD